MRSSPTFARHILVVISLLALAPAAALAASVDHPIVVAEAGDDGDDGDDVPRQRGVAGEPEATDADTQPVRRGSGSFGIEAFDAGEGTAVAAVHPGGVVCMAGCDGPSGTLVYKTPKSKE